MEDSWVSMSSELRKDLKKKEEGEERRKQKKAQGCFTPGRMSGPLCSGREDEQSIRFFNGLLVFPSTGLSSLVREREYRGPNETGMGLEEKEWKSLSRLP